MEYKTVSDIIDFVESYYVNNGNKNLTDEKEIHKKHVIIVDLSANRNIQFIDKFTSQE